MTVATSDRPIAIYYEHPDWFEPLFAELDRRHVPYAKLHAGSHRYDPGEAESPYSVVFNRMSPSAYLRGRGHAIFYTAQYLAHLRRQRVRVINGHDAWQTEISKALQLSLLEQHGLPYPASRVINDAAGAADATDGLRFPVIIKPNIGGSGAGVRRFDSRAAVEAAAGAGTIDLGIDDTAIVQELVPADEGRIVRVEVLNGKFIYAIRIYTPGDSFNLCPADVCQGVDGSELVRTACAVDAPRNGLRVEAYTPPADVIDAVERIMAAAGIEVGGVEYMIDARDGRLCYYDVNALSNFVADAPKVVGFDAFALLADWLEQEAELADAALLAGEVV